MKEHYVLQMMIIIIIVWFGQMGNVASLMQSIHLFKPMNLGLLLNIVSVIYHINTISSNLIVC